MTEEDPNWMTALKDELGDNLRLATRYNNTEYEHRYVRDDLKEEHSEEELEAFRREMIVLMLGKDKIEEVTLGGEFFGLTYWIDGANVYQFPDEEGEGNRSGYLVSIEPEAESKQSFIRDVCRP